MARPPALRSRAQPPHALAPEGEGLLTCFLPAQPFLQHPTGRRLPPPYPRWPSPRLTLKSAYASCCALDLKVSFSSLPCKQVNQALDQMEAQGPLALGPGAGLPGGGAPPLGGGLAQQQALAAGMGGRELLRRGGAGRARARVDCAERAEQGRPAARSFQEWRTGAAAVCCAEQFAQQPEQPRSSLACVCVLQGLGASWPTRMPTCKGRLWRLRPPALLQWAAGAAGWVRRCRGRTRGGPRWPSSSLPSSR